MEGALETIVWMGTWTNTGEKIDQLNRNISLFRRNGFKVGVVTHYDDFSGIDKENIDFITYDSDNSMYFSESRYFQNGFKRILPSCSEMMQDCNGTVFVDKKVNAAHQFPVMRAHAIALETSQSLNIPVHVYLEGDFWGTQLLCDKIKEESESMLSKGLRFVGFDSYTAKGGINACFYICDPHHLGSILSLQSVKDENEFYKNYPNEACEDSLDRIAYGDSKSLVYPKEKICEFLGEYGKDWDTNHIGMDWVKTIDKKTLSAFTINAPFLKQTDSGFSIFYLFKQEMIPHDVSFATKICLIDGEETVEIFSEQKQLRFNNYFYWENLGHLKINSGKSLLVETETGCMDSIIRSSYKISTDFREITGYHRIRHIL